MPSMYCFVFMYIMSFILVVSGEDWFLVWLGLEINMISFLILIYRRYSINVIESCLKYFFIQSIGSALLISMLYMSYKMGSTISLVLSYKLGAGPFFYWFPSMCSALSWDSCFLLMMFQKIIPLLLMSFFVGWVLWFVLVISLMMGVLGSFNQSNLKQLMAYSSIHHLGWIIMVMMNGNLSWFLYLIMYGLVLFSVVVLLYKEDMIDMAMLYGDNKKLIFMIGMLSMGGIPPLLGFFLKWVALMNILYVNMVCVMLLVLVSVIMLYVYIRIVYDVYMGNGSNDCVGCMVVESEKKVEMMSIVGIVFGIMLGIYIIM